MVTWQNRISGNFVAIALALAWLATAAGCTRSIPSPLQFRPLFDGRSLDAWRGLPGEPAAIARMSQAERAAAQETADRRMRAHWSVSDDGVLAFDGRGDNLCTQRDFADFELFVDWKILSGGDSGIYLRGCPQVQIWDQSNGSGGLYNNKRHPSWPTVRADQPPGEWNQFFIRMIGHRVTVHLNGVLVVDNVIMEYAWEPPAPLPAAGPIELQAHGGPIWFRNILIREIKRR